jgi:solute carrier family 25 carnitine/acylcarnitine transporter 20/29
MEDFEKTEKDLATAGWVRTAKDLFAGASGGITQVLLGRFTSFDA